MLPLRLSAPPTLRVLCLGAHSDDIEIGCAGTLLRWLAEHERVEVTWVVMSASGERAEEARQSAQALLEGAAVLRLVLGDFEDAWMPAEWRRAKDFLAEVGRSAEVDVVLTHRLEDRHQDHRLLAEIAWQCWRDHLILEYEIPKYEGDLGQPNVYVPLPEPIARRKLDHLMRHFGSQRSKNWFSEDTFAGLMRLRGLESHAPSGLAEAYLARKLIL